VNPPVAYTIILALLLAMNIMPNKALAFSGAGHQIACQIAYPELSDAAREKIDHLINIDPEYASFAKSCTWPDNPRIRPTEHYVNLEMSSAGITDDPCPVADRCVVTAILSDMNGVAQTDDEATQLVFLKNLGHWLEDIHQMLHVSFQDDRGGNQIKSSSPCKGYLHRVWDKCLTKRINGKDSMQFAEDIWSDITDQDRLNWAGVEINQVAVSSWANEAFAISKQADVGYCTMVGSECWYETTRKEYLKGDGKKTVLTDDRYLDLHAPIIRVRIEVGYCTFYSGDAHRWSYD
jgi:hypothetical protein